MTVHTNTRQLFGGAITTDVADTWLDASNLRQVPDNQEVLLSSKDGLTLIVEVLESVKKGGAAEDLEAAIRFHFDSLAHDNGASSSNVQQIFALPGTSPAAAVLAAGEQAPSAQTATPAPLLLVGEQQVKKFGQGQGQGDRVRIYLAVWRLSPVKNVDLVMSLNEPLSGDALTDAEGSARVAGSTSADAQQSFMEAAGALKIHDWGLFAH